MSEACEETEYWTCEYCEHTLELKSKYTKSGHKAKCRTWKQWRDSHLTEEFLRDQYVEQEKSMPEIAEELGLDSVSAIARKLKEHGINTRSFSKSNKTERRKKRYLQTCLDRYGVENPSQAEEVKEKKRQTFLKNYGVDNIWKADWYREHTHKVMVEKYGKGSVPDLHGNADSWGWRKASPEEKRHRIEKALDGYEQWYDGLSEEEREKHNRKKAKGLIEASASSLEFRIKDLFEQEDVPHQHQFWVEQRSYDFRIWDSGGKLLEVQGDYWHANPEIYDADDELNHQGDIKTASRIWNKDEKKKELAEGWGYDVIYIWESEMNDRTDDQLLALLSDLLELKL